MARDFARQFYHSKAWQDCRSAYLKSVGGLCEDCLRAGLYTPAKIVHHRKHIEPETINDPTVTLAFENLKAVCMECHEIEHDGEKKGAVLNKKRRFEFDEYGNIRPR